MTKEEISNIKTEIKSRKLCIKKLETAVRALSQTGEKNKAKRIAKREKLLEFKSYGEAQDAYGWGFITETEFNEAVKLLESSQEEVEDKVSAEECAVDILKGYIRVLSSDISSLEFELLPEKEQNRIREQNYRLLVEREERRKNTLTSI